MKHHQAKKILKAIDMFMEERNSPKKAESLRDLVTLVDEYIVGTTNAPKKEVSISEIMHGTVTDNEDEKHEHSQD